MIAPDRGPVVYAIIRAVRPRTVVETGVASGSSSWFILEALDRNGQGELYSVDLPVERWSQSDYRTLDRVSLPANKEPGWLVPDRLHRRWHLHLGDSRVELRKTLELVSSCEVFLHDSEHSYEVMSLEYALAFDHMSAGGVIISDDIRWNDAWSDFTKKHQLRARKVTDFGIALIG